MCWTCPYCGNENENKPLNRRHTPKCTRCGKEYITAKDLEEQIKTEIEVKQCEIDRLENEIRNLEETPIYRGGLEEHMELRNLKVCADKKQKRLVV